jgi:hypothetical protein
MDVILQEPLDPPKIVSQKTVNEYKKAQQTRQTKTKKIQPVCSVSVSHYNKSSSTHSNTVVWNTLSHLIRLVCIMGGIAFFLSHAFAFDFTTLNNRCFFVVLVTGLSLWLKLVF